MQIIVSHVNTDFDALASMIAAKKLYPEAQLVISDKQDIRVQQFLNIYRDTLEFVPDKFINWSEVTELILVDVASLSRIGNFQEQLDKDSLKITVYDHHPPKKGDVEGDEGIIEPVGAAVTILTEEIMKYNIPISEFEATLFGLGIYTDTGCFTFKNTTPRDLQAARFLMEQGMNLEMIQQFSEESLDYEQQELLNELFIEAETYEIDGLHIVVSSSYRKKFIRGLATITSKLLEIKGADAVITVVGMKKHVHIVGRASAERISLLPMLKKWGGGGHRHAGSAMVKKADFSVLAKEVKESLNSIIKPAITARKMMTSPVKTILPETTIAEAGHLMYRYGHSGYPVEKEEKLLGIITKRDLDKANHHGLGHAPVKAYMTTAIISITPETTLEEIQKMIIEHNVGRLPVVENGKLLGIISRTDIIEVMHQQTVLDDADQLDKSNLEVNLQDNMKKQLPEEVFTLLQEISQTANRLNVSVYLIGGIVRDILLEKPNDDVDIVVEGNGIEFSKSLQEDYGGEVVVHDSFGTATWIHPTRLKIDVTSSRLEYYDRPASLPDVELSTLKEDLYRRDFTINAMAICLNNEIFGKLIDPFGGRIDLQNKQVKTLHNISFVEDPTRILRAVRFETRFQFLMDNQTEKLALHSIEKVKNLSANRIIDEMKRLFREENPALAIRRLFELNFWQQFGVTEENMEQSCEHAKRLQDLYRTRLKNTHIEGPTWFSYFLIPFYNAESMDTVKIFTLTKSDTKMLQQINDLNDFNKWEDFHQAGDFHRFLKGYADEAILFFIARDSLSTEDMLLDYLQMRRDIPTYLTGDDLLNLGLKPGPFFSTFFMELESSILNGDVTSKDDAKKWLKKILAKQEK